MKSFHKNFLCSVLLFLLIFIVFCFGINSLSDDTEQAEMQTLTQAIERGTILCYTLEGSYPESLEYLKENYGLYYDEDRYFVGYEVLGQNIMPDITIIKRSR
ncbi:MAG: hypothetical protein KH828_05840 [Clostridiales bacterium]|nr:hypothetical protein [Clostridiales bacterium]